MPPRISALTSSSAFGTDVLTLVTGTTIAQIVTILAYPLITRIYGPDTFGLLAIFTSITSIIGVIACMRYELAIMLPESDEEAANIFGLCVIFVIIVSVISIIPLILFQQTLLQFLKAPQLSAFLWLIPTTIFISGIFLTLNYWNTRTKQFYRLSIARVLSSFSSTGCQLGMGFLGYASGGALIGACVLGQIVATLALGIQIMREHLSFFYLTISREGMKNVLKRYSNFPKYDVWSALLNVISWQIPIFLLSFFFSTTIVGYYSLGMTMIQFPMSFIGGAIAQVFYQRAAEAKNEGSLAPLVENVFRVLLVIGLFPILILTIIGQDIFSVVFGQVWAEAGVYTQILSIWGLVWFISSPLSMLYVVLEKQEFGLKFNIVNFFTRLASLVIGGMLGNPAIALLLFAGSGIVVYGYLGHMMLNYSRVDPAHTLKIILSSFLPFIPAGIILVALKMVTVTSLTLVITAVILCLVYYYYVFREDPQIRNLVMTFGPFQKIIKKN